MTKIFVTNSINEALQSKLADKDVEQSQTGIVTKKPVRKIDYELKLSKEIGTDFQFRRKIVWVNVIGFLVLHLMALYGLLLGFVSAKLLTIAWMALILVLSAQGVSMGAHRLFSHNSFKAHFIVRLFLVIFQTMAGQNCLYVWVRDHRQHHKYSDSDADPHNATRGLFFAHIGWLMCRKHPAVISKGKAIDMSDMEADPIVMFQKHYYKRLFVIFSVVIPVATPMFVWNETFINSFFLSFVFRYVYILNFTWLVNSVAHTHGTRPYDETHLATQNWFLSYVFFGEGWHNYHHVFPWDYRSSEFGMKCNTTTMFIDFLAYLGLVYDLKTVPEHMIKHRVQKTGDGNHPHWAGHHHHNNAAKNLKDSGHVVPSPEVHEENGERERNKFSVIAKT